MFPNPSTTVTAPAGTITLMFTDIEGSTRLLQNLGSQYGQVLTRHHAILREAIAQANGREVDTAGDGFFVVFEGARDAVRAAVAAQRALAAEPWPPGEPVRVRMGIHTGEPIAAGEGWIGLDVHRASRIASAAAGGQVLLSGATRSLLHTDLPQGVTIRELGRHSLKDLREPELLYQLEIAGLRTEFPPVGRHEGGVHNLPFISTALVGRERELEEIPRILLREDVRIVTLTGPGGTGKTRLALAVAQALSAEFENGTWFVPLASLVDPSLVGPAIARALSIAEQPSRPIVDTLIEFISRRQMLLVLDNFEQVTDAATLAAELLRACPRLELLVTSRGPLHLSSEHEYPVPPLRLPDRQRWADADAIRHSAAVELFMQRARAARPDFELTSENAAAVAEICTRLDGLPLALELAAARIRLFSPQALLSRLGRRLDLLRGGARDLPERHQALRQTIAWSHDLLNAEEQSLFRRMAVFVGGCTLEAVEHISQATGGTESADVLDGIGALTDRSLIKRQEDERGETRLFMLETIRDFGVELLEQSGESERVHHSHAMFYLALAEHAALRLTGPDVRVWLDKLEADHDNVRAAIAWAIEQGDEDTALRLGAAIWRFMVIRGHMREGRELLLRILRTSDESQPTAARARLLFGIGHLGGEMADLAEAIQYLEQCLDTARRIGDERLIAQAMTAVSWMQSQIGDLDVSETLTLEALERHRQLGDERGKALALNTLGWITLWRGDLDQAEQRFLESLRLRDDLGDRRGVAYEQTNVSFVYQLRTQFDQASNLLDEALITFSMLRDDQLLAWTLTAQGNVALLVGDPAKSARLLEESLRLWRDVGNKYGMAWSLTHLGLAFAHVGRFAEAIPLLRDGVRGFDETGSRTGLALACRAAAEAHLLADQPREALEPLRRALRLLGDLRDPVGVAVCLEMLAQIALRQADAGEADAFLSAAAAFRAVTGAPVPPVRKDSILRLQAEIDAATGASGHREQQVRDASLEDRVSSALRYLDHISSRG
jgi:predicted ATPase/class 3 adenylate cyclase